MITCVNGHANADDSKFCESCGTKLEDGAIVVDLDAVHTEAEPDSIDADPALPPTTDPDQVTDVIDDPFSVVDSVPPVTAADDDAVTTEPDAVTTDPDDDADDDSTVPAPSIPLLGVVDELEAWAVDNYVEDDPYIVGLADAVRQRHDLGMWAAVDPLLVLPEPRPAPVRLTQVVRWLAVLRNVLVFLPVALTWFAISKATDAYRDWDPRGTSQILESGESVNIEKNFLDFWSNGYGVLDEKWTITEIGRVDFYIIMVIIGLALVISALNTRTNSMENAKYRQAEAERTAIGIKIRRSLYGKRQASPASIAESLADALSDLNETTRDMAEVASRLERSSAGVESLTPQLEALNTTATVFASQTSAAITTSVNDLVSSVEKLNTTVNANLATVFESAVNSLQEAGEQLARTSASLEYGTKLLKDDIESIRKGLGR